MTLVATANAVRYTGATPVFADITSENDLTVSLESIKRVLTPRTKSVMVMHYGGYACDMPRILEWAAKRGLPVIEDAAHASGSFLDGKHLGTWGKTGCFSFFSNKNLSTGEGGMIITDDDTLAEKFRLLRSHGMTSLTWDRHQGHAWSYDVVATGYNYRIDEIRSALGRVQLSKLEANNTRRRELVALYRNLLAELAPAVSVPFRDHPGVSAGHIMPVLLPRGADRLHFMEGMKARGIQTSIHYPPIHTFTSFREDARGADHLPVTNDIAAREVTLPLYPTLSDDQVKLVVDAARESLGG
jgi:dTDP-4-amino-4,6-dideoxygalactose transaminase